MPAAASWLHAEHNPKLGTEMSRSLLNYVGSTLPE
jgi:hypothetical protein